MRPCGGLQPGFWQLKGLLFPNSHLNVVGATEVFGGQLATQQHRCVLAHCLPHHPGAFLDPAHALQPDCTDSSQEVDPRAGIASSHYRSTRTLLHSTEEKQAATRRQLGS